MSKIIEAKAVISAQDNTGSVLDKLAAKFKGVEKNAKALGGIKAPKFTGDMFEELKRLNLSEKQLQGVRKSMADFNRDLVASRPKFDHYARAHRDWADNQVRHWRAVKVATDEARDAQQKYVKGGGPGAAGAAKAAAPWLGVGAAGYYGGRAARFAFEKSKEANRETTKQRLSGLTQEQSDAISAEADRQTKNFPSVSGTEFRSAGREANLQLGDAEAGLKMMGTLGKFMTTGKVLWGPEKIDEQTRKALQVLDARQITDPERAASFLDAFTRASQVEGGTDFDAKDLRTAIRQGRDMTRVQSDRFITSVLPQIGVDMGYPMAGTGLASMHSALIGGRQKKEATAFQTKVGLRDKSGLVGKDRFSHNVDKWIDQDYIPAMQKAGVDLDDPAAVAAFNSQFFSNRTAADVAGNMVAGRAQRARRDEQQKLAKGTTGAEDLHKQDVGVALAAVNAQLTNMASSAKLAETSIAGLNSAMGLIQQAGEKMNEPGGWFDKGKKQFEDEKRDWEGVKKVGSKILDWDKSTGTTMPSLVPKWMGGPGIGLPASNTSPYAAGEDPMGADYNKRAFHSPSYWYGLGREGASAESAARLRREAEGKSGDTTLAAPGVTQSMTYGTGVQNQSSVEKSANVNVQGEVSGTLEATFHMVVDSSGLVSAVEEMKRLSADIAGRLSGVGGNGAGSTGKSSPDAAAPSPRGNTGYGGSH